MKDVNMSVPPNGRPDEEVPRRKEVREVFREPEAETRYVPPDLMNSGPTTPEGSRTASPFARQPCCPIPSLQDVGQWLCVPPFRAVCLFQALNYLSPLFLRECSIRAFVDLCLVLFQAQPVSLRCCLISVTRKGISCPNRTFRKKTIDFSKEYSENIPMRGRDESFRVRKLTQPCLLRRKWAGAERPPVKANLEDRQAALCEKRNIFTTGPIFYTGGEE